jgi:putative transposase
MAFDLPRFIQSTVPRKRRITTAGYIYHVLNRAAGKRCLFGTDSEYREFELAVIEAKAKTGMRILAYCEMPNHFHFLLWPSVEGQLQKFVQWLTSTHAIRWNLARNEVGRGAVYQSRYKSISITSEPHLLCAWRYVERNPLRANLVARAEDWRWGSLWQRLHRSDWLSDGPCPLPENWVGIVNSPQTQAEVDSFRAHVITSTPFEPGSCPRPARLGRPRIYETYK